MKKTLLSLLIVFVLGGVLYFYNLGGWDLWNPDEPRYAQITREMLQGEGWIIPHLNSEVYVNNPPFFFWFIALAAKAIGEINESAARLPSAIFALLTLMLTFMLGKRLFNEKAGLFAALILATNFEFFWLGRRANIDATLTFFTTASILFFYVGFYGQRKRWFFYSLAYCAMALGVLAKLHVAFIVPLLVIGGYFLIQRELTFFKDPSHVPGMILFLVIIGGWLSLTYFSGGEDSLSGLLYHKTTWRLFKKPAHHRPLYYYLLQFPSDFLPWSIFLPSALIYGLSTKGRTREFTFLFFWFSVIFVILSLANAKRHLYLLSVYPAVALMVGYLLEELPHGAEGKGKRLVSVPLYSLIIALFLLAIGFPIVAALIGPRYIERPLGISLVCSLILGGGGFLALLAYLHRRIDLPFYLLVAMMFTFGLFATARVFPEINRYKSARPLSQAIISVMRPTDQLGVYQFEGADFNYYTGINAIRRFEQKEELKNFLRSPQRVLCIMRERHYRILENDPTIQIPVAVRGQVGHKRLVVISNR